MVSKFTEGGKALLANALNDAARSMKVRACEPYWLEIDRSPTDLDKSAFAEYFPLIASQANAAAR